MQTRFSERQLGDPFIAEANDILRRCVHCGFCTATCPTFVMLGDELDSPRGRIYLIKELLESGRPASEPTARHLDRCMTCLSCTTTCPSDVDYMHLLELGRAKVEETFSRPFGDRLLRGLLKILLPNPGLFRLALFVGKLTRPFSGLIFGRLGAILKMADVPIGAPSPSDTPQVFPSLGPSRKRIALLIGCAQQVVGPGINEATVRLLRRHGCEVVVAKATGCCGALTLHMGDEEAARAAAKRNIQAWMNELEGEGLDAVVTNASGCGSTVKNYGHLFRYDNVWADRAMMIGNLTVDVSELMAEIGLGAIQENSTRAELIVAYHSACSLQHGQKVMSPPRDLLKAAGYKLCEVPEAHLCCGSAGTYNLLQPGIADGLGHRKATNILETKADLVAVGNIGCMVQIASYSGLPVAHTAELLDWATGGPKPSVLK